jgi:hypothetical protein
MPHALTVRELEPASDAGFLADERRSPPVWEIS